jgi:hypothetical protein
MVTDDRGIHHASAIRAWLDMTAAAKSTLLAPFRQRCVRKAPRPTRIP